MKNLALLSLALGVTACQSVPADQRAANPAQGMLFAENSCSSCHAVGRNGASPNVNAPTFTSIASRPGVTAESLSSWLRDGHNYPVEMGFYLDQQKVDALAAYMVRLRSGS